MPKVKFWNEEEIDQICEYGWRLLREGNVWTASSGIEQYGQFGESQQFSITVAYSMYWKVAGDEVCATSRV